MKKKRYKKTGMENLVMGNIKTGVTLGIGSAVVGKINPALTGGFSTIAGFMPVVNTMEMGKIIKAKTRRRRRR